MDELKEKLVSAYGQVRIGDPLDPDTLMGPLIDESAIERVEAAVRAVKEAGGEILCGGERLDRPGNFVSPVIAVAKKRLGNRTDRDLWADPVPVVLQRPG